MSRIQHAIGAIHWMTPILSFLPNLSYITEIITEIQRLLETETGM